MFIDLHLLTHSFSHLFIQYTKNSQKSPTVSNEHLPNTAKFMWSNNSIFIVCLSICETKTNFSLSEGKNTKSGVQLREQYSWESCNENMTRFKLFHIASQSSSTANRLSYQLPFILTIDSGLAVWTKWGDFLNTKNTTLSYCKWGPWANHPKWNEMIIHWNNCSLEAIRTWDTSHNHIAQIWHNYLF